MWNYCTLYKNFWKNEISKIVQDFVIEPPHDKTNEMTVRLAKTQSVWASAQSDQSLRCPHEESLGH